MCACQPNSCGAEEKKTEVSKAEKNIVCWILTRAKQGEELIANRVQEAQDGEGVSVWRIVDYADNTTGSRVINKVNTEQVGTEHRVQVRAWQRYRAAVLLLEQLSDLRLFMFACSCCQHASFALTDNLWGKHFQHWPNAGRLRQFIIYMSVSGCLCVHEYVIRQIYL